MQVLATKVVAPAVPPAMVPRPRLRDLLDRSQLRPLTLVSAPAGWGKTSLLSDWIESSTPPGRVAWVGLEAVDRDRHRFWTSVIGSLHAARPDLPRLPRPAHTGHDEYVTALISALGERPDPVVLALDDLHDAASPDVVADLELLVERAPATVRLVLSTRVDPPLRLERLRLAGRLGEIRADDLAFTADEAASLCEEVGVELDAGALEGLLERTGGWPTGVRLAALALEGGQDPAAFVESFAGDDRSVSDYLVNEVLSRQSPETLDFLLRTCQVDRVNGALADELTGGSAGRATLAELADRRGLATALDTRGDWYRYPPLLREVLRLESARRIPDALPQLHKRAARWFVDSGDPLEAIHHAVAGESWDLVADLVGQHWLPLVARGKGSALRDYVERIPRQVIGADAELALAAAGLLFEAGDAGAADALTATATELASALPEARRLRFAATATATFLYRARLRGDVHMALKAARVTLDGPWADAVGPEVRAMTLTTLGVAEFVADDVEAAGEHLRQGAGLAREAGNEYVLLVADACSAAVALREGRKESAQVRASMAVELAESRGWTGTTAAGQAYLTLASTQLWDGDLKGASEFVDRARVAAAGSPDRLLQAWIALMRGRLLMDGGRPLDALDAFGSIRSLCDSPPHHVFVPAILWEAEAWLALGEPERSRAALDVPGADDVPDVWLARARLELAEGEPEAALRDLSAFERADEDPFMPFALCQALATEALARDALRDEDAALLALERCLDVAEPRGQGGVLLTFGASLRSLLRRAIARGTSHRSLAEELLSTLDSASGSETGPVQPLLEPLSERELAVLRFLPTMLSNAEIAAEMFVSPNTVKTHLKHVYRKLDVADRRQAVRRGRDLHLLSPSLHPR